jgi:hypothetical protein
MNLDTNLLDIPVPLDLPSRPAKPEPYVYIEAARVPERLKPQSFGPWCIQRLRVKDIAGSLHSRVMHAYRIGFDSYTLLRRVSWKTLHIGDGTEIVMEDSRHELRKHLPIWLFAKGNVLVTGLGLGCVVRGLLKNPDVERITVVEIDRQILRVVGREFSSNKKVELIHGDALTVDLGKRDFDYAWHDLWTDEEPHLQVLHMQLINRFSPICYKQGAWDMPRYIKRKLQARSERIIG